MADRYLFVTGKLAAPALHATLERAKLPFEYEVAVMRITVAALMTAGLCLAGCATNVPLGKQVALPDPPKIGEPAPQTPIEGDCTPFPEPGPRTAASRPCGSGRVCRKQKSSLR